MNLVNLTIDLRPDRLNFPLPTMHPRRFHSFTAELRNVPDDVASVVLRLYRIGDSGFFELPVSRRGGEPTTGIAYAVGTCFTETGSTRYEVHAVDARGNSTALGTGRVEIDEYGESSAPLDPAEPVPVMTIPDATGAMHVIKAVPDGEGGYTTILDMED